MVPLTLGAFWCNCYKDPLNKHVLIYTSLIKNFFRPPQAWTIKPSHPGSMPWVVHAHLSFPISKKTYQQSSPTNSLTTQTTSGTYTHRNPPTKGSSKKNKSTPLPTSSINYPQTNSPPVTKPRCESEPTPFTKLTHPYLPPSQGLPPHHTTPHDLSPPS